MLLKTLHLTKKKADKVVSYDVRKEGREFDKFSDECDDNFVESDSMRKELHISNADCTWYLLSSLL